LTELFEKSNGGRFLGHSVRVSDTYREI